MAKTALLALPLALALAACETMMDPYGTQGYPPTPYPQEPYPPSPYPDAYPPAGYPLPPGAGDYRAAGTEPFWDLTIGREIIFNDRGTGLTITQPAPQPITGATGQTYRTQRLEVTITRAPCNDGMSDRTYPDRVEVRADGRLYRGCGGPPAGDPLAPVPPMPPGAEPMPPMPPVAGMPAPPLDRTRWQVIAINGRPVPPNGEYSMEFDSGRLSTRFGCNAISSTYTQTGPSLDAGALVSTRMACGDMSWETQGSAVLNQLMQLQALTPHRITLASSAGAIELVRR